MSEFDMDGLEQARLSALRDARRDLPRPATAGALTQAADFAYQAWQKEEAAAGVMLTAIEAIKRASDAQRTGWPEDQAICERLKLALADATAKHIAGILGNHTDEVTIRRERR